jgi:hypothetical protein
VLLGAVMVLSAAKCFDGKAKAKAAVSDTTSLAGAVPQSMQGPPPDIGKSKGSTTCTFDDSASKCEGYPPASFSEPANWPTIVTWLRRVRTMPTAPISRRPANPGADATLAAEVVINPERVALRNLTQRGLVLARLIGNADGVLDDFYRIGEPTTAGMTDTFYVVFEGYSGPPTNAPTARSYKIGTWRLYGISNSGTLIDTRRTGKLRWCHMNHPDSDRYLGSRFAFCDRVPDLTRIEAMATLSPQLAGKTLLETLRLRTSLNYFSPLTLDSLSTFRLALNDDDLETVWRASAEEYFAPAWITCGIGCCSVDY